MAAEIETESNGKSKRGRANAAVIMLLVGYHGKKRCSNANADADAVFGVSSVERLNAMPKC